MQKVTLKNLWNNMRKYKLLYVMIVPVILYYLVFHYYPMYGAQIAFRHYSPKLGITGSDWAGFMHFESFFKSIFFKRLVRNTLSINFLSLALGFPAPIIFAILLNEVTNLRFKKTIQTVSYMPHFLSTVVVAGMILQFTASDGLITNILMKFGYPRQNLMYNPNLFQPLYVISGIWQHLGWDSIIYIAAITSINSELYEAAKIDGSGRFRLIYHVTLPGMMPTIVMMFILRIGNIMSLGFEKIILLYNSSIYDKADVISTFVYRKGLVDMNYSYASAVGIFNSIINLFILFSINKLFRRFTEHSLW